MGGLSIPLACYSKNNKIKYNKNKIIKHIIKIIKQRRIVELLTNVLLNLIPCELRK